MCKGTEFSGLLGLRGLLGLIFPQILPGLPWLFQTPAIPATPLPFLEPSLLPPPAMPILALTPDRLPYQPRDFGQAP